MQSPNGVTRPDRSSDKSTRLHYLDWLRVIAILFVAIYHAALPFSYLDFYIQNAEQSMLITALGGYFYPVGMPLFFLLAAAGSWVALQRRTARQYVIERVKRLLIPFIVGAILLTPIQVYLEWIHKERYKGSFLAFIPTFINSRAGPDLHELFSAPLRAYLELLNPQVFENWGGHLWFLGFLFCFSLIALPLFLWLKKETGRRFVAWLGKLAEKRGSILLFLLPLVLVRVVLQPIFPDLRDWADFAYLLVFFISGYILYADQRFTQAIRRDWLLVLIAGIVSTFCFFGAVAAGGGPDAIFTPGTPFFSLIWGVWTVSSGCWVILLLYVGMRFLNFRNRWLEYGQEAILPIYLLHQPVIVAIGFFVVQWQASIVSW